jgi:hypothetical protein
LALDGFYVQHMERGRLELLVSAFRDPIFGVMITCGAGGILTEVIDDVTIERAPFSASRASKVLNRLKIIRAAEKIDENINLEAAARFIARFSEFSASAPWQAFVLEINPIKLGENGAIAVDSLLVIERP